MTPVGMPLAAHHVSRLAPGANSATPVQERRLSVSRVLSVSATGAAIFTGVTDDGATVRVVASPKSLARVPMKGETWCVTGECRFSPQFGSQLHATMGRCELPRGKLIARYLANHPDFAGVGESKARRLWEAFGERLASTLSAGDVDALEAVLTRSAAIRLVEVWDDKRIEVETVEFLDTHGFDWQLTAKLLRVWGGKTLEVLRRNPYYLLAFASWSQIDAAALKLGVPMDDERRLIGAVEAALYERLHQSHTLTSHDTLVDLITQRLGRHQAARAIQLAIAEGAVCGSPDSGYQAYGAASLEAGITVRIRTMLEGEAACQVALFPVIAGATWAKAHIGRVEVQQGFQLSAEQRLAVVMPFEHSFSALTGGAGVGKTTVLRVVIELAHRQNLAVFQMALAGRAAKRMTDATGFPAMTIAKFLSATRAGQLDVPAASLVVVDEASMLDLPTFYRILKHLPDGIRLMLVGDSAQLPPIGFGLVFHRLVGNPRVPQAQLTTVHRQAAASGIPAAASAVREHRLPCFVPFNGRHAGVSFVECPAEEVMQHLRYVRHFWGDDDWQILAAIKGGRAGIRNINEIFHRDASEQESAATDFVVGEPVVHLVNDYERGLMNGALGRVAEVNEGGALSLEFDGVRNSFAASELMDRVDLAYAISVHKAQGSQFKRVAIVIGKSRLLDHALVYTALTRGVEQVVFIGDKVAFVQAVKAPALAHMREVAFEV